MTRRCATLAELAACCGGEVRTGPFGSQLHKADYVDDEEATPVVMPKDMIGGRVDVTAIARIDDETRERLNQHVLTNGDIVLARRGDIGRRAWVGEAENGWLCGTGSMRISLRSCPRIRARYLYYYLATDAAVGWLEGHAVGATMSNLSAGVVEQLPVEFPDLRAQDAAVAVLDSIAHLIENNRRRIGILEEMARLIYREWFVHFRFPGHEDLEFVDSDLGPIAEGWQVVSSADVGEITVGGDWGKDEPESEDFVRVACLRGTDLPRLKVGEAGEVRYRWIKQESLNKRILQPTDVVVEGSGECGRSLAYTPEVGELLDAPPVYSNFCKRIRFESEPLARFFARLYNEMVGSVEMDAFKTGTTIPNLNFKALVASKRVPLPPEHLLDKYAEICRPMERLKLLGMNSVLREMRDLLLPRLMSGELDVSNLDLDLGTVA